MSRFDAARRAALTRSLLGPLLGHSTELLAFEEVKEKLHVRHLLDRGLQEIPLDLIVGSLGRASEFDRAFLPRREALRERWTRIEQLAEGSEGFPPVELYKVGDVYSWSMGTTGCRWRGRCRRRPSRHGSRSSPPGFRCAPGTHPETC